jgi:hypothetical protein
LRIEGNVVLLEVLIEPLCTQNLRNLHQLIIVVVPMEKWLFAENLQANGVREGPKSVMGIYHRGEHASIAPHVQAIVILLEINKKLWPFKVARSHPDVVFCLWMVEFG